MAQPSKKQDILLAAKQTFICCGYHATSMDMIAEAASTTKKTVYNHFANKNKLFSAVIDISGEMFVDSLAELDAKSCDVKDCLKCFLCSVLATMCWHDAILLQRRLLAVADEFPELMKKLFVMSMQAVKDRLTAYYLELGVPEEHVAQLARNTLGLTVLPYWQRTMFFVENTLVAECPQTGMEEQITKLETIIEPALPLVMSMIDQYREAA